MALFSLTCTFLNGLYFSCQTATATVSVHVKDFNDNRPDVEKEIVSVHADRKKDEVIHSIQVSELYYMVIQKKTGNTRSVEAKETETYNFFISL